MINVYLKCCGELLDIDDLFLKVVHTIVFVCIDIKSISP